MSSLGEQQAIPSPEGFGLKKKITILGNPSGLHYSKLQRPVENSKIAAKLSLSVIKDVVMMQVSCAQHCVIAVACVNRHRTSVRFGHVDNVADTFNSNNQNSCASTD